MILVLDDLASRHRVFKKIHPTVVCVSTKDDCVEILKEKIIDILYLDHDLEKSGKNTRSWNYPNSGSALVEWMCVNFPIVKKVVIHTSNRLRAPDMLAKLKDAGYAAEIHTYTAIRDNEKSKNN